MTLSAALAGPGSAGDYVCAAWTAPDGTEASDARISILKRMIVFEDNGAQVTARMFYGTLSRITYLEEASAIVAYGDPVKGADGTPTLGDTLTIQRLVYHAEAPRISQTTCRAER